MHQREETTENLVRADIPKNITIKKLGGEGGLVNKLWVYRIEGEGLRKEIKREWRNKNY